MMYTKNYYFEIRINTPKVKRFQVIYKLRAKHEVWIMCDLLDVSISWYYKYKALKESNNTKEDREKDIKEQIENIYYKHNWYYGYRRITMEIQRQWLTINDKKPLTNINIRGIIKAQEKGTAPVKTEKENHYGKHKINIKDKKHQQNICSRTDSIYRNCSIRHVSRC